MNSLSPSFPSSISGFVGYRWYPQMRNEQAHADLAGAGLPPLLCEIASRRVPEGENALHWVDPRIATMRPDPFSMKDMDVAAGLIAAEILAILETGEPRAIGLFGDYDVDGAASTALMARFLADLGIATHTRIPDRIGEGYGPNLPGLLELRDKGCGLILILDTGALAFDVLEKAGDEGLRIVVIDHHICEERLPRALAVVNPNRRDDTSGFGYMCAGGLALMVAIATSSKLKAKGFFGADRPAPDLRSYLDLAALATVADVAPLRGVNRAFVATGLKVMRQRGNPGLSALLDVSGTNGEIRAHHIGFQLGPRINAGGRISDAWKGALLLRSDDPGECVRLAGELNDINAERKAIEEDCRLDAIGQVDARLASRRADGKDPSEGQCNPHLAWALGDYHEGVIGIAAGRLKERFLLPSIVFSRIEPEDGVALAKASGRSIEGFDMGSAVLKAASRGLLVKGGGHAMAAGLTVAVDRLDDFVSFMDEEIAASDFARDGAPLRYDLGIDPADMTVEAVESFARLEPFGQGNPSPRFLLKGWKAVQADVLKEVHLRVRLQAPDGSQWKAMLFNGAAGALASGLTESIQGSRPIDIVARLKINSWRDQSNVEIDIEDARFSQQEAGNGKGA